jgi:23S rRNA maturation mini-RNase III
VLDKDGWSCATQADIENAFADYFQELFTAGDSLEVEACTNHVERKIKGHVRNEEEAALKEDLNSLLEQEELKWKQRAKENWLKNGDRNIKYFHACANQPSKKNVINEVSDKDGRSYATQADIENAFVHYFQELFTTGDSLEVEACTNHVERKIDAWMNQQLLADFTRSEIYDALQQMAPMKAPGPDGFPACFF